MPPNTLRRSDSKTSVHPPPQQINKNDHVNTEFKERERNPKKIVILAIICALIGFGLDWNLSYIDAETTPKRNSEQLYQNFGEIRRLRILGQTIIQLLASNPLKDVIDNILNPIHDRILALKYQSEAKEGVSPNFISGSLEELDRWSANIPKLDDRVEQILSESYVREHRASKRGWQLSKFGNNFAKLRKGNRLPSLTKAGIYLGPMKKMSGLSVRETQKYYNDFINKPGEIVDSLVDLADQGRMILDLAMLFEQKEKLEDTILHWPSLFPFVSLEEKLKNLRMAARDTKYGKDWKLANEYYKVGTEISRLVKEWGPELKETLPLMMQADERMVQLRREIVMMDNHEETYAELRNEIVNDLNSLFERLNSLKGL